MKGPLIVGWIDKEPTGEEKKVFKNYDPERDERRRKKVLNRTLWSLGIVAILLGIFVVLNYNVLSKIDLDKVVDVPARIVSMRTSNDRFYVSIKTLPNNDVPTRTETFDAGSIEHYQSARYVSNCTLKYKIEIWKPWLSWTAEPEKIYTLIPPKKSEGPMCK